MTDEGKMYAVKNDDDKYLFGHHQWGKPGQIVLTYSNITSAKSDAKTYGGTVVKLVEKPAPVVVSEEEAEMLEQAKCDDDPAELIVGFVNSHDKYDDDCKAEDRLMRAYVNGWEVEKQKRLNVKVPHTETLIYFKSTIKDDSDLGATSFGKTGDWVEFTAAEIERYGLDDCERVEVTDDEQ